MRMLHRALVGATDASGQSIFSGRTVTGFSNFEEEKLGAVEDVPFLLQSRLESLGAKYEKATEPWGVSLRVTTDFGWSLMCCLF